MACMVCSMITMVTPSRLTRRMIAKHLDELVVAEPGQRLVEQEEPRARRQRARQLHEAELLGGQAPGDRMGLGIGETDTRERRIGVALGLHVGPGAAVGADDHVLEHGHAREGAHHLEGAADAAPADRVRLQADQARSGKTHARRPGARGSR